MRKINTTKVNHKKIGYMGEIYHVWQYGEEIAIADPTGYDISLKTDVLNGFIISEVDIYTIDPEEYIHEQFCKFIL